MCPDWELNQRSFGYGTTFQPTEPRWPVPIPVLIMVMGQWLYIALKLQSWNYTVRKCYQNVQFTVRQLCLKKVW